ncbi:MAG TPA: hypothetical protein VHE59_13625 [Mucilaginibacter sp.]|nr:hypothetical protein [Mucilaginibacter sp.]
MKFFITCLFLTLLIPLLSKAQSNYKPGYIIKLDGDTARGFIDYRGWSKNPRRISFRSNAADNATVNQFTVHDINGFGVNGLQLYERDAVTVSTDEVEMANIRQGIDTGKVADTVFLQVLTTGKNVALYSYTDQVKTRYYILYQGVKVPRELVYHVYLNPDNASEVKTDYRFKRQLIYISRLYQKENSSLESRIDGSSYSETDILPIINTINGVKGSRPAQQKLSGTRWFAGAGVSYEDMNFTGNQFPPSSVLSPKIDAGFDLIPNKTTQRYFLRIEASFTEASHSFSDPQDANGSSATIKFSYNTVSLAPQVVYNFYNTDNFKVFMAAGALLNFSSYGQHQYTIYFHNIPQAEPDGDLSFLNFWAAFYGKAGILIHKHIELYADYIPTTTLTDNFNPFAGKVSLFQTGLNYIF